MKNINKRRRAYDIGVRKKRDFVDLKHFLNNAVDIINSSSLQSNTITGLKSGFYDLDDKVSGLQKGELIVIAGQPCMGCTSFAMNIAENIAIEENKYIAVFSLNMSGDDLALGMISSIGHINRNRISSGKLSDTDWPKLSRAVGILAEAHFYIDDSQEVTINELCEKARKVYLEYGELGLIVIDDLQVIEDNDNLENQAINISNILRSLKALATNLNCPVILLSNLKYSLENRENKRPLLLDLDDGKTFVQYADLIMFVYRDEIYNPYAEKGIAEIIIAHNKNGETGAVKHTLLSKYGRFENYSDTDCGEYTVKY